jgi:hypothetical protein
VALAFKLVHVLLCSLLLCLQLEQMQQLRMQSDTLHSSAAAAAAMMRSQSDAMALRTHSDAMLRSQSEVLALRTHSEQGLGNSHGHHQQQQQAMAMGLARLQAHMQQAQAAAAQQQAAQQQQQLPMHHIQQQSNHIQQHQQHEEDELLPPIAEDAVGSAFMLQHPMDAVELALHNALQRAGNSTQQQQQQQQHAAQELMGLSGAAAVGHMVYGGAAASDVDGSSAEISRGGGVGKRGRASGEVHAVADPDTQGVLFMTASELGAAGWKRGKTGGVNLQFQK